MPVIITFSLHIFLPHFSMRFILKWLLLQTIYALNKEIPQFLGLKSIVYNWAPFQIKSTCTVVTFIHMRLKDNGSIYLYKNWKKLISKKMRKKTDSGSLYSYTQDSNSKGYTANILIHCILFPIYFQCIFSTQEMLVVNGCIKCNETTVLNTSFTCKKNAMKPLL